MPKVVGIKFRHAPKVYNFEAGDLEYEIGQGVIVETSKGTEFGEVVTLPEEVSDKEVTQPLKPVVRIANAKDNDKIKRFDALHDETLKKCEDIVSKSGLDMKLVDVEYTFDETKLIVHFTADNRVDFRELVRSLASAFKLRIELKQIGSRDECRMIGGLGSCGMVCCCKRHLNDFPHVSIKMAKNQNLSLNPAKISGLCGRLMCCLEYENEHYAETNKLMPKVGSNVVTAEGKHGTVVGLLQLKNKVKLRVQDGDFTSYADFGLGEFTVKPKDNNNQNNNQNKGNNQNSGNNQNRGKDNNGKNPFNGGDKKDKKEFKNPKQKKQKIKLEEKLANDSKANDSKADTVDSKE